MDVFRRLRRTPTRFAHVLQASARLTGQLTFDKALLLEGEVEGPVVGRSEAASVVVRGRVVGDVTAHTVFVEGTIVGAITAHTVVVRPKGVVQGNLQARVTHLEEGGQLTGHLSQPAPPAAARAIGSARLASERLTQDRQGSGAIEVPAVPLRQSRGGTQEI
jgi:cytoskeletal protein CcmA (bactofilin family)